MSNKSGVSQQVVSLPSGGGAISGMGEKFSPDLHTGTGNFTIPITLPAGRNGFQPELNLVYTTGGGNSAFGLGWDLSIPGVTRKTSGGVPKYDDVNDVLILSGAEDLVPVAVAGNRTQYRPRTEGLYAIIERELDANNDYWEVKSRDGLISVYGTSGSRGADPATIHDPEAPSKVCSWKLTETRDPLGNKIVYEYERDLQETETRHWNQLYLSRIRYVDYEDDLGHEKSLVHVSFEYEERPDPFSTYRSGFEVRTTRRCTRITIETDTDQVRRSRSYELRYDNTHLNGVSLLCEIQSIGHDGVDTEPFPPVSFGYTDFNIDERDLFPIFGTDLPTSSLANSDMELVDLFGNGLPDIIQMNGTIRYWRNLGEGRFDVPRLMHNGPAGITLGDPGVQMLDANGDGKADLMVNQIGLSGYYPLTFAGEWDRRSFKRYKVAPSFDLGDPEVKLVDLDGDGVTDAIRSGSRMECFFNDAHEGWSSTLLVERESIETFPSVNFSDPRVKLADVTGDGLQDVMMVYDGNIEYWPYMGYGKWGKRIHMANSSRFPYGYDPKRVLVGDVDGDGLADIVYVDHCRVFLWINQSGNGWSDPIEINGTPPVSDMDAVRLVDLLGSGISGVLWSTDATSISRSHMHFLDFTGGLKPYLLSVMDNNIGAVTQVSYRSSTEHYLAAQQDRRTQWKTSLPFPVQVLSRVEIIDAFSGGKLTSEYKYHHGCWDGGEREFRGFGRTDRYDTEVFEEYNAAGLHCVDTEFETVEETHFSPPTLTKRWFHQGALGDEFGDWYEADYSDEYWSEDPQKLERPPDMTAFINGLERRVKRDALRALRGTTLRMELYALDGTDREDRPYTVTESLSGIREDFPPDLVTEPDRSHIFFPHPLAQRTTQWERGDDPVTRFTFTEDYDAYGQSLRQTRIACPRGWRDLSDTLGEPFLATRDVVVYAVPVDPSVYIVNRLAKATNYEIINDGTQALLDIKDIPDGSAALSIIGQSLNFYDGDAFVGRGFGEVGEYGALVRTENLVLTEEILHDAYRSGDTVLPSPEEPPYLKTDGPPAWSAEYPNGFRDRMPPLAGYTFQSGEAGSEYARGYFTATLRRGYDFHYGSKGKGLVLTDRDPLGNDITIHYDDFDNCRLLPSRVTEANGLETVVRYDYRVLRAREITSQNENRTAYIYTPTGLLKTVSAMGKATENVGDTRDEASLRYVYNFMAFVDTGQPVSVRIIKRAYHVNDTDIPLPERDATIESMHYSDGFGRLLQSRTQAEDLTFGDPVFGDAGLGPDQSQPVDDAVGQLRGAGGPVRVVVSGWQIHDNKGRVVEKYEPFFSEGWEYAQPADEQRGQKVSIYYDPLEREIRRVFPDNSERLTVQGTPADLADPLLYTPTPWEIYTYDPNDNAGRTHAAESTSYQSHWNTPTSVRLDALNRQIETILRNGPDESTDWYRTAADYDIQGNLLTIRDPLDRATSQNIYDLKGNLLRTQSIDAGTKRVVLNAAAKVAEQRDSKGALILNAYDEVSRPIRKWARDKDGEQVALREHLIYGDGADSGLTPAQAASNNLLGNIYRHYDEAGLLELPRYDFKGNILEKSRRVISDASVLSVFTPAPIDWQVLAFRVDWQPSGGMDLDTYADTLLDAKVYQTSFKYDALNRLKSMLYPEDVDGERKELIPRYNRAGALEGVELDSDVYVEHIAYNAKGQRTLAAYGNGVMTRYAYDPQTFHLARLRTERYTRPDPLTYHPTGSALQDMAYDYDLRGNMLALHHRTPGSGTQAEPERLDREFTYDPIYRLLTATGRECDLPVSDPPCKTVLDV